MKNGENFKYACSCIILKTCDKTDWFSFSDLGLHSGGTGFDGRPGYRLLWHLFCKAHSPKLCTLKLLRASDSVVIISSVLSEGFLSLIINHNYNAICVSTNIQKSYEIAARFIKCTHRRKGNILFIGLVTPSGNGQLWLNMQRQYETCYTWWPSLSVHALWNVTSQVVFYNNYGACT
jgi:hypothetical protein